MRLHTEKRWLTPSFLTDRTAKYYYGRAPDFEHWLPGVTPVVNSDQAPLRHPKGPTYRCFLPDLAGFIGFRCAGPNLQRHLQKPDPTSQALNSGIHPAAADCG
ncbi:hypothetical protein HM1_0814 [Heliomicrobium modesticaldum Ice1]|uniref:Uncharacterized protein n=1 Tax=Heliobacterium modesticaldum (strain ATCC 51547 / Ice1) TaxID=498761 RepID=B0TAU0_HELMI|nr:hypothetical protein HM1_0814 [Heliomicrobium modesticaldum Ice1]